MMNALKYFLSAAVIACSLMVHSAFLPDVGNGTELNVWTRNISGVLAAAKETGDPILLVMVNEAADGSGCSRCKTFVSTTLKSEEFAATVKKYRFYMVFLNDMNSAISHGYVSNFYDWWRKYAASYDSYPFVGVLDSNGVRRYCWEHPQTGGVKMREHIETALKQYCKFTTIFDLKPGSPSSTVLSGQSWTGSIVRSGASGLSGTVAVSLSGNNAANYTVTPSQVVWDSADGVKQFSVSGGRAGMVADEITVSIAAGGDFVGSKRYVSYMTKDVKLLFKGEGVDKTLSEFSADRPGLAFSRSSTWYKPTGSANVLQTTVSNDSFTVTASSPGVLTVSGSGVKVSDDDFSVDLSLGLTRIGLSAGDQVVVVASAASGQSPAGLTKFDFSPVSVALTNPANGISLPFLQLNSTGKLDLSWRIDSADEGLKFTSEVFKASKTPGEVFSGAAIRSVDTTSIEGIANGFLSVESSVGEWWWGVRVTASGIDHGSLSAETVAKFTVSARPEFLPDLPATVIGYLKGQSEFDFSADDGNGGKVTYSAEGLPKGMEIDPQTGIVSGTPKKKGSFVVTVTAENAYGASEKTFTLVTEKFPSSAKGKYSGIFFDSSERMAASFEWSVSSSGKWSGTALYNGKKEKSSGLVCFDETGKMVLRPTKGSVTVVPLDGTDMWTTATAWNGLVLYGKKNEKAGDTWSGTWMSGVEGSAASGYARIKVSSSGKASFSGKIFAKNKFSGKGQLLVLDSAFVKEHLPSWNWSSAARKIAFAYSWKKTSRRVFDGGFVFFDKGWLGGNFMYDGLPYESYGSIWEKPSFEALDSAVCRASVTGVSDPVMFKVVSTSASKIKAESTDYTKEIKAKISAAKSTGIFKGSFKEGKISAKFEGALYVDPDSGELVGVGGGYFKGDVFFDVNIVPESWQ